MANPNELTLPADSKVDIRIPIYEAVSRKETIVRGQNIDVPDGKLVILTMNVTTGKYEKFTSVAGANGTSRPLAFLGHSVDASGGDISTVIYTEGIVIIEAIEFPAGITIDTRITAEPKDATVRYALEYLRFTFKNRADVEVI